MALTPDNATALVTQFMGSSQASDSYDIDSARALLSQNIDFILGQAESVQAGTRRGTSQVFQNPNATDGAITSLANWYVSNAGQQNCFVVMYSPVNGLRLFEQAGSFAQTFTEIIIAVTGAAIAVAVGDGLRLYVAFCNSTGRRGISQGYVYGLFVGEPVLGNEATDTLFSSPLPATIATVATSQPGAGAITAGLHRLAYVFTTRNGNAEQLLNPVTAAGVFAPVSFTAADGAHNLRVVITFASIPTYLQPNSAPVAPSIQIVMTSAANPAAYYLVPGATGVIPSTPGAVTITFSINDGDLVEGTDVTLNQNLLSAVNGSGPFSPSSLFTYSSRMMYVTLDSAGFPVVYASDVNNYQSLSAATGGIYLEGRQIPVHGCSLGGLCYIASISGLYSTQDNGGKPSTWAAPTRVDGSVGILSPTCMLASSGRLLLASEKGLYIYRGGAFPQIALSYWQAPDWQRINWNAPTQVQVVDDVTDQVIRVQAPLNVIVTGATNTNPIQITTAIAINKQPVANPHLFQTGLSVTISGVGGNTAANTTAVITVTGDNTFTIPVAGNGAYTTGGVVKPNAPNAQMCWNYSKGETPGEMFYSIMAFASYRASSMAIIRNLATNYDETWFGPSQSNPGGLVRRVLPTDSNIHRDVDLSGNPAAIHALYETSNLPGAQDESMTLRDSIGAHLRVSGLGPLNVTGYALDHKLSVVPTASPVTLAQRPGLEYLLRWFIRSEQHTIALETNQIDAYFVAALIKFYYSNSLPMR